MVSLQIFLITNYCFGRQFLQQLSTLYEYLVRETNNVQSSVFADNIKTLESQLNRLLITFAVEAVRKLSINSSPSAISLHALNMHF